MTVDPRSLEPLTTSSAAGPDGAGIVQDMNDVRAVVRSLRTALGPTPEGSADNVSQRLDELEADTTAAEHIAATSNVHGIADTSALILEGDSRLTDERTPGGPAGGALSGTYPNPSLTPGSIEGSHVSSDLKDGRPDTATMRSLGDGAHQAVAGDDYRLSNSRVPTGSAGGALSGSYPSPGLANNAVGTDNVQPSSITKSKLAFTPIEQTNIDDAIDAHLAAPDPHSQYQSVSEKGAANGYPSLDSAGKIPSSQLPAIAINDTFVVNSQAAMLALTAQKGDICKRTDLGNTFVLSTDDAADLASWVELTASGDVLSVNGQVGAVLLAASDVGALDPAQNLNDVPNKVAARSNLGLGSSATHAAGDFESAGSIAAHAADTDPHGDRAYADGLVAGFGSAANFDSTDFDASGTAAFAVASHTSATDPHGDRAYADSLVADLGTASTHAASDFDAAGTAATAVSTHAAASDPHGDRAYAASLVSGLGTAATHAATDFETAGTASSAIAAHNAATDPHGDRAYALSLVDDLSGVSNPTAARSALSLGTLATASSVSDAEVATTAGVQGSKVRHRWGYKNSGNHVSSFIDRGSLNSNSIQLPGAGASNGVARFQRFVADKTDTINTLRFFTNKAASGASNAGRVAIYEWNSGASRWDMLRSSGVSTTANMWSGAVGPTNVALSSSWSMVAGTEYVIGILSIGASTQQPEVIGRSITTNLAEATADPFTVGSITGLSDLPANFTTASLGGSTGVPAFAQVQVVFIP